MSMQRRSLLGAMCGTPFFACFKTAKADPVKATAVKLPAFQSAVGNNPAPSTFAYSPSAASIPLVVTAAPSQTANLTEWRDSAGSLLAYISPDGVLHTSGIRPL